MAKCFYCGCELRILQPKEFQGKARPSNSATKDHVIPRCRGGNNEASNKVPACLACNAEKGGLTLDEFRLVQAGRRGLVTISPDVFKFFGEFQQDCSMIRA